MRATCSSRSEAAERAAGSSAAAPFAERIVSDPQASVEGEAPPVQSFGDRVAAQVAARSSQLVLGLDPDPAKLWPKAVELADAAGGADPLPDAGRPRGRRALRARDRGCRRPLCRRQAAGRVLRAARRTGLGRAAGDDRPRTGGRADRDRRRQARRHRCFRSGLRAVVLRCHADCLRAGTGSRRRCADRQPTARSRLAAAVHRRRSGSAAAACSCWPGPRTPGPPTSRRSRCREAESSAIGSPR